VKGDKRKKERKEEIRSAWRSETFYTRHKASGVGYTTYKRKPRI